MDGGVAVAVVFVWDVADPEAAGAELDAVGDAVALDVVLVCVDALAEAAGAEVVDVGEVLVGVGVDVGEVLVGVDVGVVVAVAAALVCEGELLDVVPLALAELDGDVEVAEALAGALDVLPMDCVALPAVWVAVAVGLGVGDVGAVLAEVFVELWVVDVPPLIAGSTMIMGWTVIMGETVILDEELEMLARMPWPRRAAVCR